MPRVLVLDEGFMSGAATAIGLRDAGCAVTVLAATGGRGQHRGHGIAWELMPALSNKRWSETVARVVDRDRVDHILAITEPLQRAIWQTKPSWERLVHPPTSGWQRALLCDKGRLSAHARAHEVSIPTQVQLSRSIDVIDACSRLGLPIVIKGVSGRGGCSTVITNAESAALDAWQLLTARGERCIAQRYIDGQTYLVGGLWVGGHAVRRYGGRKVRQYPRRTGPAALIRSELEDSLWQAATNVFASLEWTGLASADFIRDTSGQYHFLEVNPRPWGSIAAVAAANVDLWSPLVSLLEGSAPVPDLHYTDGVECAVLPLFLLTMRPRGWRRDLALVRRAWRSGQRSAWSDLGQVVHLAHRLRRVAWNW